MNSTNSLQSYRIATLYITGFLLIFGYAFARPCIDSLFLEHYNNSDLPMAWLITSFAMIAVIAIYNRLNQRYAILSLFGSLSLLSAVILALLLGAYSLGYTSAVYMLYIWKELYMVVLMETFWSFADIVFHTGAARKSYGFTMAVSSCGGIIGNFVVGPTADALGTSMTLSLLVPFLILGFLVSFFARKHGDEKPKAHDKTDVDIGIKTLLSSRYLVPMAFLACTAQIVAGLIEFSFNGLLQEHYSNVDMRTNVLGNVHAAVSVIGVSLQLTMSGILRVMGLKASFVSIPLMLAVAICGFMVLPQFAIMVVVKIVNKSLDYSLFRGIKEIIYIPLTRPEKTQGKGLIDIFMYRMARGLSSLILMGLIALGIVTWVMDFALVLVLLWLILAVVISQRYQNLITEQQQEHYEKPLS